VTIRPLGKADEVLEGTCQHRLARREADEPPEVAHYQLETGVDEGGASSVTSVRRCVWTS
jgi:hypothetical protein